MRGNGQRGFTLIEIMMVVALIGLTLSMALPGFVRSLHRQGMGKAEHDLVEACQDARRKAIFDSKPAELVIHPLEGTFGVPGVDDQSQLPSDVEIEILGVNFIDYTKQEEARVHFYENGTSDEFKIVLHGADGSYRTISLDIATALTRVTNGIDTQ
jgi:general secretion pathway protein H